MVWFGWATICSTVTGSRRSLTSLEPMVISITSRSSSCCNRTGIIPPSVRPFSLSPRRFRKPFGTTFNCILRLWGISCQNSRLAASTQRHTLLLRTRSGNFSWHSCCRFFCMSCLLFLKASLWAARSSWVCATSVGAQMASTAFSFSTFKRSQYCTTSNLFSRVRERLPVGSGWVNSSGVCFDVFLRSANCLLWCHSWRLRFLYRQWTQWKLTRHMPVFVSKDNSPKSLWWKKT